MRRKRSKLQGRSTLLAKAHLSPSTDKVLESLSQSAELGFHAALSCMFTDYNSLIFLDAK